MVNRPSAIHLLPPEAYPLDIHFLRVADDVEVHHIHMEKPDTLMSVEIPGLATQHGPIRVRIVFGNGEIIEQEPPDA